MKDRLQDLSQYLLRKDLELFFENNGLPKEIGQKASANGGQIKRGTGRHRVKKAMERYKQEAGIVHSSIEWEGLGTVPESEEGSIDVFDNANLGYEKNSSAVKEQTSGPMCFEKELFEVFGKEHVMKVGETYYINPSPEQLRS